MLVEVVVHLEAELQRIVREARSRRLHRPINIDVARLDRAAEVTAGAAVKSAVIRIAVVVEVAPGKNGRLAVVPFGVVGPGSGGEPFVGGEAQHTRNRA